MCGGLSVYVGRAMDRERIDGHGSGDTVFQRRLECVDKNKNPHQWDFCTVKHGTPTLIWAPAQLTGTYDIICFALIFCSPSATYPKKKSALRK